MIYFGMDSYGVFRPLLLIFALSWQNLALTPDVHKFIDAHFHNHSNGQNIYFCTYKDATENLKSARHNSRISRRVKVLSTLSRGDDEIIIKSFSNRASVFVDSSCNEGLQFLSKNTHKMSSWFRWLIFVDNVSNVLEVLNSSRLELDSDVTLLQKHDDGSLEFSRLSRMYYKTLFSLSANYSLQESRKDEKLSQAVAWRDEKIDLRNYTFNTALVLLQTKHKKPEELYLLLNNTIEPGVENIRRYFVHMAFYLMQICNFSHNATVLDWGILLPDGTYTGAFGAVDQRLIEIAFTGVMPDESRSQRMDFSFPVADTKFLFALLQPKKFGTPTALVVPFDWSTWIAFLVLVMVLIGAMRISVMSDMEQLHNDSWGGSMLLVIGGVCQRGIPDTANQTSSRMTYLVLLVSPFLIYLHYNNSILNGLILPSPDPIQNIQQLIASEMKLACHNVSYMRLEMSRNDTYTKGVTRKLIPQKYLRLEEGLDRVRKEHFAFYAESTHLRNTIKRLYTEHEKCVVTEIPLTRPFSVCFFWRKGSPFAEVLNRGLIKMRERGIYDYLNKYWLAQASKCPTRLIFAPIQVRAMTLAYVVFMVGLIISLNVVFLEILVARRQKKKNRTFPFVK